MNRKTSFTRFIRIMRLFSPFWNNVHYILVFWHKFPLKANFPSFDDTHFFVSSSKRTNVFFRRTIPKIYPTFSFLFANRPFFCRRDTKKKSFFSWLLIGFPFLSCNINEGEMSSSYCSAIWHSAPLVLRLEKNPFIRMLL